ncbi:Indigoidine synthase A like protein-domain-containing protein [Phlyctochytrium arcticum]|nr:Indigoidine synthase A like protein-domain-containing protein [Phlyctochytrium arcticum]
MLSILRLSGIAQKTRLQAFSRPTSRTFRRSISHLYDIHPEVKAAIRENRPVVALESTIISHGMPYPQNLETALAVEQIVREEGCVPATIAILDGRVKVGLSRKDLEKLAKTGLQARKTSRRDIALVVAQKSVGATTVSGTMLIAHEAGIKVFVTGGIGGVHRGGEGSMDISADLTELGRTPVAVVCAGAKSILDIERTLEFLETQGVTVVSYGTNEFPAFYTPKSGFESIANMKTPEECAAMISANQALNLQSGMVIAVPIPEADAPKNADEIEGVIANAVEEARLKSVRGKNITPFLLDRVKQVTKGASLTANIALVKNNARIGSQIAASLAGPPQTTSAPASGDRPFIVGGTVMDISAQLSESDPTSAHLLPALGTSHAGVCGQFMGGVGRNMAEACHRTGGNPVFFSVVGNDLAGETLLRDLGSEGMDVSNIRQLDGPRTAMYNALLHKNGEMIFAVADMDIHHQLDAEEVRRAILSNKPPIVAVDGNLSWVTLSRILETCAEEDIPVIFEPTSESKATTLFQKIPLDIVQSSVRYVTPNEGELRAMAAASDYLLTGSKGFTSPYSYYQANAKQYAGHDIPSNLSLLHQVIPDIILTRGSEGVITSRRDYAMSILKPETIFEKCVSVTGAGDSLVGTLVTALAKHYRLKGGVHPSVKELAAYTRSGMRAAQLSVNSYRAVSIDLTPDVLS